MYYYSQWLSFAFCLKKLLADPSLLTASLLSHSYSFQMPLCEKSHLSPLLIGLLRLSCSLAGSNQAHQPSCFFSHFSTYLSSGSVWVEINTEEKSRQMTGVRWRNHSVIQSRLKTIINKCKWPLLLQRLSYHTGACGHTHVSGNDCVHVGIGAHVANAYVCWNGCAFTCLFSMGMDCWSLKVENTAVLLNGMPGGCKLGASLCPKYSYFTSLLLSWHQSSPLGKKFLTGIWCGTQSIIVWMNELQLSVGTRFAMCLRFKDVLGNGTIRYRGNLPPI